jgi:hypothetical protein
VGHSASRSLVDAVLSSRFFPVTLVEVRQFSMGLVE